VATKKAKKLRKEAAKCVQIADRTADDRVAAALLAYACELEQRARLIERAEKPTQITVSGDRAGSRSA
jgi:hypothetical protein